MRPSSAAIVLAVALLGCGKSQTNPGPGVDQFAATMADAFCKGLAGCCAQVGTPNDDAACHVELRALFATNVCAGDLACDPSATPTVCATKRKIGETCTSLVQCASAVCEGLSLQPDGGSVPGTCVDPASLGVVVGGPFDVPRACRGQVVPPGQVPVPALSSRE